MTFRLPQVSATGGRSRGSGDSSDCIIEGSAVPLTFLQSSQSNLTGTKPIPLETLPPDNQNSNHNRYNSTRHYKNDDDEEEELYPESTSNLLRRHIRDSTDTEDNAPGHNLADENTNSLNIFQKIHRLMSKTPLLLRSAPGFGTGSYGAAPVGASTENSEEEEDNLRRREKRKKSSSALRSLRNSSSAATFRSTKSISRPSSSANAGSTSRSRQGTGSSAQNDGLEETEVGASPIKIRNADTDSISTEEDTEEALLDENEEDGEEYSINEEDPPDNSPYAQVRASVSAIDNTTLSINTPRMWALSMLFAILGSSTNLFFSLRYPSVSITPVIALLLVHPLGLMWDGFLKRRDDPEEEFIDGHRSPLQRGTEGSDKPATGLRRLRLWLAQGRWNEKEHSCVYISSNVSFGFAFATDVIVEQTHFYNQKVSIMYQLLLILSTQILGYAFAGLTRRFLVRPGGMLWPGTLMSAAMFTTLHKEENTIANGWKITRWKFFFVVWFCSFIFYFLPGLLMPALSYFSVITWFAPKNVIVANLFGVASGLGLFPVTFDWAQIAYIGSPLLTPFWAAMNVVGGLVIVMWILAPIAYYKNIFFSSYMPILSSSVFDNTGKIYDVSKILTSDFVFDKQAYENYSRVFLPITYVLSYGLQFAALASLLTHTTCWHGRDIWKQWKRSLKEVEEETKPGYNPVPASNGNGHRRGPSGNSHRLNLERTPSYMNDIISQEDVHNRLMKRYKDAPMTWYLITFVSMLAVGIFVVE